MWPIEKFCASTSILLLYKPAPGKLWSMIAKYNSAYITFIFKVPSPLTMVSKACL